MTLLRHRVILALGVLAAVAAMLVGPTAHADPTSPAPKPTKPAKPPAGNTITWSVQPSSAKGPAKRSTFSWTNVKPRTVIHDYVAITNYSKVPVTFQVYATDAFTTSSGTLDLLPRSQKPKDVGSWATFQHATVTVPAKARVNEPFALTVPDKATPGDHTGGIIASVSQRATASNGQPVTVDRRIGVPIHLRVTGALVPTLTIDSISSGYHGTLNPFGSGGTNVAYTVHNTGNVRLSAAQAVSVTGPFGATLATAHPNALPQLSPGDSFRVTVHLSGVFPAGPLTVHVRLTPAQVAGVPHVRTSLKTVSRSVGQWATPLPQLLLLLLIVAVGVGAWWLLRWRRGSRQAALAAAVAVGRRQAAAELARAPQHSTPEAS